MTQPIFLAADVKDQLQAVEATTFSKIGIRERDDLQRWVLRLPDLLQEPLLVVTSEFDRFDKSDRRLDILALDAAGRLVVVELKRELEGSFADQQAIRYAAFCSTMTMEEVVREMADYHQIEQDEAERKIQTFLGTGELPELSAQPRIILAGSSLDDQELTSTVLWLRTFGIDISCVELVPYQLPNGGPVAIVPRTIIPLAEAKDYLVRVQMKARKLAMRKDESNEFRPLWEAVMTAFNALEPRHFTLAAPGRDRIMQVRTKIGPIHYEWTQARAESLLRIAIHFEDKDRDTNLKNLDLLEPMAESLEQGAGLPLVREPWGENWARAEFRIPLNAPDVVERGAYLMNLLINRTWPTLQHNHVRSRS
jgi:hypothetical protein